MLELKAKLADLLQIQQQVASATKDLQDADSAERMFDVVPKMENVRT